MSVPDPELPAYVTAGGTPPPSPLQGSPAIHHAANEEYRQTDILLPTGIAGNAAGLSAAGRARGAAKWKVNKMMSPDPYSSGDSHWQSPGPEGRPASHVAERSPAVPCPVPTVGHPATVGHTAQRGPEHASRGGILQRQLMRLIGEILGDESLNSEVRLRLLRHIAEHPGHPEQAMLAHLQEIKDAG